MANTLIMVALYRRQVAQAANLVTGLGMLRRIALDAASWLIVPAEWQNNINSGDSVRFCVGLDWF